MHEENSQGLNKNYVKNFKNKSTLHFPLLPAYTNLSVQSFISSPVYLLFCTRDRAQVFANGKQKLLHTEVSKRKLASPPLPSHDFKMLREQRSAAFMKAERTMSAFKPHLRLRTVTQLHLRPSASILLTG